MHTLCIPAILTIHHLACDSKIAKPIVVSDSVDVVNTHCGPVSIDDEPDQPMNANFLFVDISHTVSVFVYDLFYQAFFFIAMAGVVAK